MINLNIIIYIKLEYLTTALMMPIIDFQENSLAHIKRIDCALLPPSRRTLEMMIRRTQYVTALWTRAMTASPGDGLSPTNYGWSVSDNLLKPTWYEGPAIPDSLFMNDSNYAENMEFESDSESDLEVETINELVSDSDGEAWSEDSDSEKEDRDYVL